MNLLLTRPDQLEGFRLMLQIIAAWLFSLIQSPPVALLLGF